MNTKTKEKKNNQHLSAKNSWKYIGKSIFSNQAVIDGRKKPWYFAVLIALLNIVLIWIPLLTKGYQTDGAQFIKTDKNAQIDTGFKTLFGKDYFKAVSIGDDGEDKILTYDTDMLNSKSNKDSAAVTNIRNHVTSTNELGKGFFVDSTSAGATYTDKELKVASTATDHTDKSADFFYASICSNTAPIDTPAVEATSSSSSSTTVYDNSGYTTYLDIYFVPTLSQKDMGSSYSTFRTNFINSVVFALDTNKTPTNFLHSFVIFGQDDVVIEAFPLKSSTSSSVLGSLSAAVREGTDKQTMNGTLYSFLYSGENGKTNTTEEAYASFGEWMRRGTRSTQIRSTWANVGIMSAIAVATMFITGLIAFIMEKKKTSTVEANFWQGMDQGITLSFTPSVIGMAFGFFNQMYAMVFFIGAAMLRVVWMANRINPPMGQQENKPVYQARS